MKIMRVVVDILGILAILIGIVWFLQGAGMMPGSYMTGQEPWTTNGVIAIVVGIVLLVIANWEQIRGGRDRPHGMTP